MTKNDVDIEKLIVETYVDKKSPFSGSISKTAYFLLPMIDLNIKNKIVLKYFKNAYLDDKGIDHDFIRPIFILFKVKDYSEKGWHDLTSMMRANAVLNDCRVMDYNVGVENGYNLIMYVFQVPDIWQTDYYKFKRGMYSKFSNIYKSKFSREAIDFNGKEIESIAWGAMFKSNKLKNDVAREFTYFEDRDSEKNHIEFLKLRKSIDSWDEIWDSPKRNEEYYRFKK